MSAASDDSKREYDENSDITDIEKVEDSVSATASMSNAASKLDDDEIQLLKQFAELKLHNELHLELQECVKKELQIATAKLAEFSAILKTVKPFDAEPLIEKLKIYVGILKQTINGKDGSESKPI